MTTTEIVLAVIAALPPLLGALGRLLQLSDNQRMFAVGEALEGAGVDVGKLSRALGDARRGVPLGRRVP